MVTMGRSRSHAYVIFCDWLDLESIDSLCNIVHGLNKILACPVGDPTLWQCPINIPPSRGVRSMRSSHIRELTRSVEKGPLRKLSRERKKGTGTCSRCKWRSIEAAGHRFGVHAGYRRTESFGDARALLVSPCSSVGDSPCSPKRCILS